MQKIFSFYNYESQNEWFTYQNIFTILKAAGYHTVWISNQESNALVGLSPSSLFSRLCDRYKFTDMFNENIYLGEVHDEAIFPYLDEELAKATQKNFFVLHLIGTHFHYHKRYTESFRKFTANDEFRGKGFDGPSQRAMRADYDNAILYNDFIIDEIIKRFEDKNAIVIYISDHGEEVYDVMDHFAHDEINTSRNMLEIPFIIWLSEEFRANYPELTQRIASSIHRPYMTDDLIHTIMDIAGVETQDYDPTRSIINEKFNSERPRIFKNFIYDKEKGLSEIR